MPFKVSRKILSAFEDLDKDELEAKLWAKTGGRCFLCEDEIKRATDDYEADHDEPDANKGATTIDNLYLAHIPCNRAKQAAGSRAIRPFLKFSRYLARQASRVKYDGVLSFFEIKPRPTVVNSTRDVATFEFPDGSERSVPVMRETNEAGEFEFVYVDVPRNAIYNDDECQPRVIKKEQVGAIFGDIRRNPLHEPPSARLSAAGGGKKRLLMFDGQHKTIANWLMDRDRIVLKIYLNLSAEAARELVNSIQAKIRKLPLSPFELAAKLSEEWEDKLAAYEKVTGEDKASEAGFINWLPADDRTRAKQAFRSALVQRLLSNPELRLPLYAKGQREDSVVALTEQGIRTKVIERLVFTEPRAEQGEALSEVRDQEAANIVRMLNHLTDSVFELPPEATEVEKERAKRMSYQQSLAYGTTLLKDLWQHVAMKSGSGKFALSDELTDEQWERINAGIDRLVAHPVWTAPFTSEGMQALKVALEKNQQAQSAFESLALDLPYLLTGDAYPGYKKVWGKEKLAEA